ncbi:hypothetical protein PILCRDRAFT_814385 [Piloderma croceum F 1598]|uniref:Uncharacterized protein n=1 Tax=Piloderma croceum (strain F 1598) TaxID=765440 RepID=A0A0C3CFG4_PILCF|nr:hypothetical protein PILCRDRAFT_814385 [Piloderma croceum F 1598]
MEQQPVKPSISDCNARHSVWIWSILSGWRDSCPGSWANILQICNRNGLPGSS